jgi:hypothetical protein
VIFMMVHCYCWSSCSWFLAPCKKLAVLLLQGSLWSPFSKVKLNTPQPFPVLIMHVHRKCFKCQSILSFILTGLQLTCSDVISMCHIKHFALKMQGNAFPKCLRYNQLLQKIATQNHYQCWKNIIFKVSVH